MSDEYKVVDIDDDSWYEWFKVPGHKPRYATFRRVGDRWQAGIELEDGQVIDCVNTYRWRWVAEWVANRLLSKARRKWWYMESAEWQRVRNYDSLGGVLMKQLAGWILVFLVLVLVITLVIPGVGLAGYKLWAPQWAEAEQEVFTNSTPYVQGKQQYLSRLHYEWQQVSDAEHRGIICATARHEVATLERRYIPDNLKDWECVR